MTQKSSRRRPIISARRTDNLEALLQKLWSLRPMYKDKHAFTITAGVAALIREIEYEDARFGRVAPTPTVAAPSRSEPVVENEAASTALAAATEDDAASKVSPDVEW